GVHEDDAEIEVVEEPRAGLFGRMRGEARVRARIMPTRPRPKAERGTRRRRRPEGARRSESGKTEANGGEDRPAAARSSNARRRSRGGRGGRSGEAQRGAPAPRQGQDREQEGRPMDSEGNDATVEEQAAIMRTFLEGLIEAFDLEATFAEERVDEDTI